MPFTVSRKVPYKVTVKVPFEVEEKVPRTVFEKEAFEVTRKVPYVAKRKEKYLEQIQVPREIEEEKSHLVYDNEDFTVDLKVPFVVEGSRTTTRLDQALEERTKRVEKTHVHDLDHEHSDGFYGDADRTDSYTTVDERSAESAESYKGY